MARAKNTSRSEARKRTRDEARADLAAQQEPEDGAQAAATDISTQPKRRSGVLFKWPDIRADIASIVPQFRTKKLLWLPFGLILIGFVLGLMVNGLPPEIQQWVAIYFQFFFNPVALFTYFIAGFLATRASYIFGGLAGLMMGIFYVLVVVIVGYSIGPQGDVVMPSGSDLLGAGLLTTAQTTFIGAAAGGFAGWYRDFLRRMQDNSKARQVQREQEAKAQRAASRQESRKAAKQKPAS